MARDPQREAVLGLHRFGFAPRPGSIAAIAADPRGALIADIERRGAGRIADSSLLRSDAAIRISYEDGLQRRKALREMARVRDKGRESAPASSMAGEPDPDSKMDVREKFRRKMGPRERRRIQLEESAVRIDAALAAEIGLTERLVWFWSNHFCVSTKKGVLRSIVGAFEREAIRPHVLGRFSDMLLAVESHPAMLLYLDNTKSIGPNSRLGRRGDRGLNENLAREILELHTLGVRSVYTQSDVTSFAKVITGWTMVPPAASRLEGGKFEFVGNRHEPGSKIVLGKSYADDGVAQGRAVLKDLARHPATAQHIATKLVTHFVADTPPASLVASLAKRFLETEGDLKEVTRQLVLSDEAWDAPRSKLKRPGEWMIGAMRSVEVTRPDERMVLKLLDSLGEPLWEPPSPKGFPDQSSAWMDGLAERLDVATHLARRFTTTRHPSDMLEQTLGPLASTQTKTTVSRAEDRTQALTLLFMAPEFQVR
jgi:uncharacterized protein (DUF1800 family)